ATSARYTLSLHDALPIFDRYGNVSLNLGHAELLGLGVTMGSRVRVVAGGSDSEARVVQSFADVGEGDLLLYEDAWSSLALAVNRSEEHTSELQSPYDLVC